MGSYNKIANRWELLEGVIGVNLKNKFSAYGWWQDSDLKISKGEHWHGWWNECFDFVSIFPKSFDGRREIQEIADTFKANGWDIDTGLINGGISIHYCEMTAEESKQKAYNNLINGGRMSD